MNIKQVLVYGVLESANDLRSVFVVHAHFKKLFHIFNFSLFHYQTQEHEFGCLYAMSIHKNHFKKRKYGTDPV